MTRELNRIAPFWALFFTSSIEKLFNFLCAKLSPEIIWVETVETITDGVLRRYRCQRRNISGLIFSYASRRGVEENRRIEVAVEGRTVQVSVNYRRR